MSLPATDRTTGLRSTTRRVRRRLRALVVLHRRWLVAGCLALAVLTGLRVVAPPPPATADVVVAAHDLPGGRVLTSEDVVVRQVPTDVPPAGSSADAEAATGRTLAGPVRAGEFISDRRVLGAALLDAYPGSVAVPVRLPDSEVRGLLQVGDRVDLVAGSPRGATTVAEAAPVLALPRAPTGAAAGPQGGVLLVVAVPEVDALDVVRASAAGVLGAVLLY